MSPEQRSMKDKQREAVDALCRLYDQERAWKRQIPSLLSRGASRTLVLEQILFNRGHTHTPLRGSSLRILPGRRV